MHSFVENQKKRIALLVLEKNVSPSRTYGSQVTADSKVAHREYLGDALFVEGIVSTRSAQLSLLK